MITIETSVFSRLIQGLMSDDEYRALQEALITRPETGDLKQEQLATLKSIVERW